MTPELLYCLGQRQGKAPLPVTRADKMLVLFFFCPLEESCSLFPKHSLSRLRVCWSCQSSASEVRYVHLWNAWSWGVCAVLLWPCGDPGAATEGAGALPPTL